MATLIGYGGHSDDILDDLKAVDARFTHHSEWDGSKPFIVGINDPRLRAAVAHQMGWTDAAWVHRFTYLNACSWGYGTHINYGVTATRTNIGRHCTISPGVTICGDVVIGDRVLIGAGATICDRVHIGNDATIGAGAVVLPESNIPDGETWIGVPARVRR
jgi:acetyltransferase-like isoleucine patch superfamily enzyme